MECAQSTSAEEEPAPLGACAPLPLAVAQPRAPSSCSQRTSEGNGERVRCAGLEPVTKKNKVGVWVCFQAHARTGRRRGGWVGVVGPTHPMTGVPAGVTNFPFTCFFSQENQYVFSARGGRFGVW